MTNMEIKSILKTKGVENLFHANTVCTAITFLKYGGLLSRGAVENMGLIQTSQISDNDDKKYGVFYDIFFDSVDIHKRTNKLNKYGPLTFVYNLDVIDSLPEGSVKITKKNPIHWTEDMRDNEKYFTDVDELEFCFQKGDFGQHITLVDQHRPISFDYLCEIILDNPNLIRDKDRMILKKSRFYIAETLEKCGLRSLLVNRGCSDQCNCSSQYNGYKEGYIYYRFSPEIEL
ncbi:hypothetical protein [Ruminococcus sp.]